MSVSDALGNTRKKLPFRDKHGVRAFRWAEHSGSTFRSRVHIFRPRAPKGSQFTLRFRSRASKGSHFSSSGSEGFTVHPSFGAVMFRPRASKGSHFSSSGAEGFTFSSSGPEGFTSFVLGCGRVRVSHPRAPKGSHFPSLGAEGFTFLVLVRRRVHTSRPRVSKGSHFPHAGGPGARGFDFSPRRPAKNLVLKKMHFPYVVSNKKRDFWLLTALTGFGGPGVPEGSTFQWSVLRAAKKFEPSGEMVSKL